MVSFNRKHCSSEKQTFYIFEEFKGKKNKKRKKTEILSVCVCMWGAVCERGGECVRESTKACRQTGRRGKGGPALCRLLLFFLFLYFLPLCFRYNVRGEKKKKKKKAWSSQQCGMSCLMSFPFLFESCSSVSRSHSGPKRERKEVRRIQNDNRSRTKTV